MRNSVVLPTLFRIVPGVLVLLGPFGVGRPKTLMMVHVADMRVCVNAYPP